VAVPAGTALIRAGDPAGSAYVVRQGRLEVEVDGRLVRELGPGAILGELALLTGEQRSAGIRARRDSTVLELPRDAFDDLLATDATASRLVLTQVAQQLRTAGASAEKVRPTQPTVVAVVGLHPGAGTHWWRSISFEEQVRAAQELDRLGYDYIMVPEHIVVHPSLVPRSGPFWVHSLSAAGFDRGGAFRAIRQRA